MKKLTITLAGIITTTAGIATLIVAKEVNKKDKLIEEFKTLVSDQNNTMGKMSEHLQDMEQSIDDRDKRIELLCEIVEESNDENKKLSDAIKSQMETISKAEVVCRKLASEIESRNEEIQQLEQNLAEFKSEKTTESRIETCATLEVINDDSNDDDILNSKFKLVNMRSLFRDKDNASYALSISSENYSEIISNIEYINSINDNFIVSNNEEDNLINITISLSGKAENVKYDKVRNSIRKCKTLKEVLDLYCGK